MSHCLVIGGSGQVGLALRRHSKNLSFLPHGQLDITDKTKVHEVIQAQRPSMVINAAAYTDVDGAEGDRVCAFAVNARGPENLAGACQTAGIPLIHLSTDFVFDGSAERPYGEDDPVSPINVYGESKGEGEAAIRLRLEQHIIVRTAWVFSEHRANFAKSILRNAAKSPELRVVADQVGGPSEASDIAAAVLSIRASLSEGNAEWGTYHFSGAPPVSRFDFAAAIIDSARPYLGQIPRLTPVSTGEYPLPAKRPARAVLDCGRIYRVFGIKQPDWKLALSRIIESCARNVA